MSFVLMRAISDRFRYWNRYPGAQCDIESYIYMPLLEEVGYVPVEKYTRAKELLAHSRMIGEKFDLYSRALFQTEATAMRWNESKSMWSVETTRGDKLHARFVVPAAGPLHRPKLPGLPGIESFKGHAFHSSRFDYDYTGGDPSGNLHKLADKRVGIIGTGATAVQIVPHLGASAGQLYVFQRTPSSIDVRGNRSTDPEWKASLKDGWQQERMDNFNVVVNGGIHEKGDLVADGWTDIIRNLLSTEKYKDLTPVEIAAKMQLADFQKMQQIRARVDEIVKDKETAESLKPWYNQFCKRPCFHDEYLQTFNNPNVKLVDTKGKGVEAITEKGVVANGQEYELDCLIYATGFELATDWSHRSGMEIYGRDGLSTTQKWQEGASTLHGWASRGFPNCFFVSIVQAALTPNFMHVTNEQAKHIAYVISQCRERGINTIEPTDAAEKEWVDVILKSGEIRRQFLQECTPGYYNNEGDITMRTRRNGSYGGGSVIFLEILKKWREENKLEGLETTPLVAATAA
jgi:cation diffusion facilitator CzcD-associated flavoprotein CzcO